MAGENIFNKLKKITEQVTEQGKNALDKGVTKASFAVEKSKLNSQIEGINKEIKKLMQSLGEAAYVQWKNGNKEFEALEELILVIQQKKEEIVELNKKIEEIELQERQLLESALTANVKNGAEGQENEVQAVGSRKEFEENTKVWEHVEEVKEDVEVAEKVKAAVICPECGTQYDNPVKFCRNCGTKM